MGWWGDVVFGGGVGSLGGWRSVVCSVGGWWWCGLGVSVEGVQGFVYDVHGCEPDVGWWWGWKWVGVVGVGWVDVRGTNVAVKGVGSSMDGGRGWEPVVGGGRVLDGALAVGCVVGGVV